ncbi:diguanylate cyclase [Mycoplasmatota bacterium zrk1]
MSCEGDESQFAIDDITKIKQGIIKYNFRTNQILFDNLFLGLFELEHKINSNEYISIDSKIIVAVSSLERVIDFVVTSENSDISELIKINNGRLKISLYLRKVEFINDIAVVSYLTVLYDKNQKNNSDILSSLLELSRETSNVNLWWIDLSKRDYLLSNHNFYRRFGIENATGTNTIKDYRRRMDEAVKIMPEYEAMIRIEKLAFFEFMECKVDYYSGKYPVLTKDNEIILVQSIGKLIRRDKLPISIVGIDFVISNEISNDTVGETLSNMRQRGLDYSNIGMFWIIVKDGKRSPNYNKKARELVGYTSNKYEETEGFVQFDSEWCKVKRRTLKKFPEYSKYYDNDNVEFSKFVSGETSQYRSIVPFLLPNETVNWIEFRSNVISRDETGKPRFISGVAIEINNLYKEGLVAFDSEKTVLFDDTKNNAIELANLLIWKIDYSEDFRGSLAYSSKSHDEVLGLEQNKEGDVLLSDFFSTIQKDDPDTFSPEDLQNLHAECNREGFNSFGNILVKHKNLKNNKIFYMKHFATVVSRYANGNINHLSGYLIDVTKEHKINKTNKKLETINEKYQQFNDLAISAGELMVYNIEISDDLKSSTLYCNDNFVNKLGILNSYGNFIKLEVFLDTIEKDEEGSKLYTEAKKQFEDLLSKKRKMISHLVMKNKNMKTNEVFYLEHFAQIDVDKDGKVVSLGGFQKDITSEILSDRRLKYLAENDILTDLYNRNYYEQFISEFNDSDYSIIYFDIDGLKLANDVFGHYAGDEILRIFGRYLKKIFYDEKNIFRVGGDEFVIISKSIEPLVIEDRIASLKKELQNYSKENKHSLLVSSGYKVNKGRDLEYREVLISAENEMYRAKLASKSGKKEIFFNNLIKNLYEKTDESLEHCERIGELAKKVLIGFGWIRAIGLDNIYVAAKFHDIGKLSISDSILLKPGELTNEEYEKVKTHSETGYKIIDNILGSDDIAEGVLYHHERFDGLGYPYGLKGKEIPLFARIISICDTYISMINDKIYRKAIPKAEVLEEIVKEKWKKFDPDLVDIFIDVIDKEN